MREDLIKIIQEAGKIATAAFYNENKITEKAPKDLVTDADKKIELFLKHELSSKYPKASFYGEEFGYSENRDSHLFVIDPIDGTANFIFGVPYFAVSIAEIIDEEVVVGIVFNPLTEDLFYADRDTQPALNGRNISVSSRAKLQDSYVILGFSANSKYIAQYQKDWGSIFSDSKKALPLLSPSLNLCAVATGKADAFIDFQCSFEGQVAGAYILQKAGGHVRNYDDSPYDYKRAGIIGTNGTLIVTKQNDI